MPRRHRRPSLHPAQPGFGGRAGRRTWRERDHHPPLARPHHGRRSLAYAQALATSLSGLEEALVCELRTRAAPAARRHRRGHAALRQSVPSRAAPSIAACKRHGLSRRPKPDKPPVGVFEQATVGFIHYRPQASAGARAPQELPGYPIRCGFGDRIERPGITGSSAFADDDRCQRLLDRPPSRTMTGECRPGVALPLIG